MRQSVSLSHPINRDVFHGLMEKKSEAKVWKKKSVLSPISIFSSPLHLFFFHRASAASNATNHVLIFPATTGMIITTICLQPSKVESPPPPQSKVESPLPPPPKDDVIIAWFFMQWADNCMVAGLGQQSCEPGLDLAQRKESGLLGHQSAQPDPVGFNPAHNNNIIIIIIIII